MAVQSHVAKVLTTQQNLLDAHNLSVYNKHQANPAKGELYIRKPLFGGHHFEVLDNAKTEGKLAKLWSKIAHAVRSLWLKVLVKMNRAERGDAAVANFHNKTVTQIQARGDKNADLATFACAVLGLTPASLAQLRAASAQNAEHQATLDSINDLNSLRHAQFVLGAFEGQADTGAHLTALQQRIDAAAAPASV